MVAQIYNAMKAEARLPWVQGQPEVQRLTVSENKSKKTRGEYDTRVHIRDSIEMVF